MALSRPHGGSRRQSARLGLTALELVVAVVIVAALAVSLLPALAKAREHAVLATCLSHQHQLGVGYLQYQQDAQQLPGINYQEGLYFAGEWGRPYFYGGMQAWMTTHETSFWDGFLYYDLATPPRPGPPAKSILSGMGYTQPYTSDDKTFYCPGTTASFTDNFGGEPWWGSGSWYSTWTGDHPAGYYKFGQQGKGTLTTYFYRGGMFEKDPNLPDHDPRWALHQNWTNLLVSRPDSPWLTGKPMLTCYWPGYNGSTLDNPMMDTVPHGGTQSNLLYADGSAKAWELPEGVLPLWNWYNASQYNGVGYTSGEFYGHAPWWWVIAFRSNQ